MCPDMRGIISGDSAGKVDLYYNDMWGLMRVMSFIEGGYEGKLSATPICR